MQSMNIPKEAFRRQLLARVHSKEQGYVRTGENKEHANSFHNANVETDFLFWGPLLSDVPRKRMLLAVTLNILREDDLVLR